MTVREEERPPHRASRSQPGAGYDAGMRVASRMDTIGTETAFEAAARARALEAQGRSIIHLEIGEPDFDTPANIRDAAKKALDDGWTHYGPSFGLPALREAIAADATTAQGLPGGPRLRGRHPGRQADHVLRDAGAGRAGRRGHLPRPGLPHLRVDGALCGRHHRAVRDPPGERLPGRPRRAARRSSRRGRSCWSSTRRRTRPAAC